LISIGTAAAGVLLMLVQWGKKSPPSDAAGKPAVPGKA
jgi:hypothetical protein